jgi:hypothetical protein
MASKGIQVHMTYGIFFVNYYLEYQSLPEIGGAGKQLIQHYSFLIFLIMKVGYKLMKIAQNLILPT